MRNSLFSLFFLAGTAVFAQNEQQQAVNRGNLSNISNGNFSNVQQSNPNIRQSRGGGNDVVVQSRGNYSNNIDNNDNNVPAINFVQTNINTNPINTNFNVRAVNTNVFTVANNPVQVRNGRGGQRSAPRIQAQTNVRVQRRAPRPEPKVQVEQMQRIQAAAPEQVQAQAAAPEIALFAPTLNFAEMDMNIEVPKLRIALNFNRDIEKEDKEPKVATQKRTSSKSRKHSKGGYRQHAKSKKGKNFKNWARATFKKTPKHKSNRACFAFNS